MKNSLFISLFYYLLFHQSKQKIEDISSPDPIISNMLAPEPVDQELTQSKYYKFKKSSQNPFANLQAPDPLKDFDIQLGEDGHMHSKEEKVAGGKEEDDMKKMLKEALEKEFMGKQEESKQAKQEKKFKIQEEIDGNETEEQSKKEFKIQAEKPKTQIVEISEKPEPVEPTKEFKFQIPSSQQMQSDFQKLKLENQEDEQKEVLVYQERQIISLLKNQMILKNIPNKLRKEIQSYEKRHQVNIQPQVYVGEGKVEKYVSLTSTTFEQDKKQGRMGPLTLIENQQGVSVRAVLNPKVFAFFSSQQKLIKLVRISQLKLQEIIATPCFYIYSERKGADKILVCFNCQKEKQLWDVVRLQPQALVVQ